MKKTFCLLMLFAGMAIRTLADGLPATSFFNAGSYTVSGSFTSSRDNSSVYGFTNNYGQPSNDVWYSFTISSSANNTVAISLCGSSIDTYLHVLNSAGTEIATNDDNGPLCSGLQSSISLSNLAPGTYYVDAEGYSTNTGTINFSLNVTIVTPLSISYPGPQSYTAGTGITALSPVVSSGAVSPAGQTSTFAGTGSAGSSDGSGTSASFNQPLGATVDPSGNIYIAEGGSHIIRKITPGGQVSLFAGNYSQGFVNNTNGASASFYHPVGLASDAAGNIYVADEDNNVIRLITPLGAVSTFAGTGAQGLNSGTVAAGSATFKYPCGVAVDGSGNVYVADSYNNVIRKISGGMVSLFAGSTTGLAGSSDGQGTSASFNQPFSVVTDAAGNLYVTDRANAKIRKITPGGLVTTLAGTGSAGYGEGSPGQFNAPTGLAIDKSGNLYIADEANNRIRIVTPAGSVSTLAGNGTAGSTPGAGSTATFNLPFAMAADANGLIYSGDVTTNLIRKIVAQPYTISPVLPAGLSLNSATGVISGTPAAVSAQTTYTIKANNNDYTAAAQLTMAVVASGAPNPSQNQNYVVTYTPRMAGITTDAQVASSSINKNSEQVGVQYIDGLGRLLQDVQVKGSPVGNDVIQPAAYDAMGRQAQSFLSYTTTGGVSGSYRSDALAGTNGYTNSGQYLFYQNNTQTIEAVPNPYTQSAYELSPLGRVTEQGMPGAAWQIGSVHSVKTKFIVNTDNEVLMWKVNANGAAYTTSYSAGKLYITTSTDEDGRTSIIYTDFSGNVVCRKVQYTTGYIYTYYVYDDMGNLRYVIPPLPTLPAAVALPASFTETDNIFKNFFYGYHYDGRNRAIEKKIPGRGWEYMVYNKRDQVVLSQTPAQLALGLWTFSKYDAKGRLVMTGNYVSALTRSDLQNQADSFGNVMWESFSNATTNFGYTNTSFPDITGNAANKALAVTYYDNYKFLSNTAVNPNSAVFAGPSATVDTLCQVPLGQVTGSLSNVIGAAAKTYLLGVNQYDTYGRMVQSTAQTFLGGTSNANQYDIIVNQYSFNGVLTQSTKRHYLSTGLKLTLLSRTSYDHAGRKTLQQQQYITPSNTGPLITLAKYDYNEVGQLIAKHLHSTAASPVSSSFLQHLDYRYNSRGWLTRTNTPASLTDENYSGQSDVFAEQLDYDKPNLSFTGTVAQFNGNISTTTTQTLIKAGLGLTQEVKGFVFQYDAVNRLTSTASKAASGNDKYNEALSYDELGNVLTLNRNNSATTQLNKLAFDYGSGTLRGSALMGVQDNGGAEGYTSTYTYWPSGSQKSDTKSTITNISYNELNLPATISFSGGKSIAFMYSPTGEKIERVIKQGTTVSEDRSYVNGIEYVGSAIEYVHTPEGRAVPGTNNYTLQYIITDHLGNTRAVISDADANGVFSANDIIQLTDYYAFGRQIQSSESYPPLQYKFNGKEFSTDMSSYDYGARYYNPTIARWNGVDPKAELSRKWNPYAYAYNNPVRNIDPDGQSVWDSVPSMTSIGRYLIYGDWDVATSNIWTPTASAWDQGLGNFYNFALHLTPFGGIIDFTNSARKGDIGGAVLGLASSAAFVVGDFIPPENPAHYINSDGYFSSEALESTLETMAKNDHGIELEAYRWQEYQDETYGVKMQTAMFNANQEMMAANAAESNALIESETANTSRSNIALGLADDLHRFSTTMGFPNYRQFTTGGLADQIQQIGAAIQNPAIDIHFNMTGFSRGKYFKFDPSEPVNHGNITNWELHTIINQPSILERTTFYRDFNQGGGYEVVPPPKF